MDEFNLMILVFLGFCVFCALIMADLYVFIPRKKRKAREEYLNRNVNVTNLTTECDELMGALRSYAYDYMEQQYRSNDKQIYTQKGDYRAAFVKEASKFKTQIMQQCLDGNVVSEDFQNYSNEIYPDLRIRDIKSLVYGFINHRKDLREKNFDDFMRQVKTVTPEEFFEIKSLFNGDVVGAYVIHNQTKNKYYVGQATRLLFRINQHFTGHGNGDVYADYKYGDDFAIKIVKLSNSGYSDLDKLEKDLIEKYDAYNSGYNKTSGNR